MDASLKANNDILQNAALQSVLNTQFLFQIGIFTAVPMIVNLILEQGILKVGLCFIMEFVDRFDLCGIFGFMHPLALQDAYLCILKLRSLVRIVYPSKLTLFIGPSLQMSTCFQVC